METATVRTLAITNENNKLGCDAFIVINLAPSGPVHEKDMERLYSVKHNDDLVIVQLVDILRLPLSAVNTTMTLPASGKAWHEWIKDWRLKNPNTTPETCMAVYYYKRKID